MRIKGFYGSYVHRTLPLKLYDLVLCDAVYIAISTGLIYNKYMYIHVQILCKTFQEHLCKNYNVNVNTMHVTSIM